MNPSINWPWCRKVSKQDKTPGILNRPGDAGTAHPDAVMIRHQGVRFYLKKAQFAENMGKTEQDKQNRKYEIRLHELRHWCGRAVQDTLYGCFRFREYVSISRYKNPYSNIRGGISSCRQRMFAGISPAVFEKRTRCLRTSFSIHALLRKKAEAAPMSPRRLKAQFLRTDTFYTLYTIRSASVNDSDPAFL